jgi:uncharacterized alkaline shock family protein YloU
VGWQGVYPVDEKVPGKVTVASGVLVTIVQLTTQEIPGVHEMCAAWTRDVNRFLGDERVGDGVEIRVDKDEITIDLYIIVEHDVSMLQLGRRIQAEVARAAEEMTGMDVKAINVHIEDVRYPPAQLS